MESPQRPRRRTVNQRAKSARRGAPEPPGRRRMRSRWAVHARPEPAPSCPERKCVVRVSRKSTSSGSSGLVWELDWRLPELPVQNLTAWSAARGAGCSSVEYRAFLETSDLSQSETASTSTHAQYFRAGLTVCASSDPPSSGDCRGEHEKGG